VGLVERRRRRFGGVRRKQALLFSRKKKQKSFIRLGSVRPRSAKPIIPATATPKLGGWASPVVEGSEPESGSPFCFFFLQEKEDPY
jgi:hypothetical protein